jgi:hypothetical protein
VSGFVIPATPRAQLVIGTSGVVDFLCTGTNDGGVISAAANALPAAGGKIIVKNGTYNFNASTDRIFLLKSNVTIEGETPGGVTFKAISSLHPGGANFLGRYGILTIGGTQISKISNVTLKNIIFDINNVAKTAGLTLDGGTSLLGSIGLQDVTLKNVKVINHGLDSSDPVEASLFCISGVTNDHSATKGNLDRIFFENVEVANSNQHGWWFLGGYFTNISIDKKCYVHNNNRNGIEYYNYDAAPVSSDWDVSARFEDNMKLTSGSAQAHFRDQQQTGIKRLTIDGCYFGPAYNAGTDQDYCLTPYWAEDLKIVNCKFDRIGSGISIGASVSGTYNKLFPITRGLIKDNTFYQARSCFDPDATIFMDIVHNKFHEVKDQRVIGSYSRHYPTTIKDNTFYNCHTDNASYLGSEYHKAAIQTAGDGFVIEGNRFIDDRKLTDPTTALTLSTVAGGALSSRTYYVRYTWKNDVGETLGRSEQTQAVAANQLLRTDIGSIVPPSGAKLMNIYVSTTSGSGWTLQTSITNPTKTWVWTEPTTGLVAGAALPVSNTTDTKTKYGIYELTGGATGRNPNVYSDNHFEGIPTPIFKDSTYSRVCKGNTSYLDGVLYDLEKMPVTIGSITGATTLVPAAGENQLMTLTGNVTFTFGDGEYVGQLLTIKLTQDGTGSRIATWPAKFKKSGGTLTLSTSASAVDNILMLWDGTNWNELSRSLNVS